MMSDVRKQKMIRFFNIYDGDKDGVVSKTDFELPVKAGAAFLGYVEGSPQFNEMYQRSMGWWSYIRDQSGKSDGDVVAVDEFLSAMDALVNNRATLNNIVMEHAKFTIELWDSDRDGLMSEEEYVAAHTAYNTAEEAAREAFNHLDRNSDGQLSYGEIIQAVEEYFVSDDPNAIGNWFILE